MAPFSTVMLSMSSGLMLLRPSPPSEVLPPPRTPMEPSVVLGLVPKLVLSIGTPFTTMSGEFWPENDDWPRIRILDVPPGPVPRLVMFTPAILPCSVLMKFGVRLTVISSAPTVVVE